MNDEDRGVKAGINMIKRLWEWNEQSEKDGKPPLDMGLGLKQTRLLLKYWVAEKNGLYNDWRWCEFSCA